MINATYTAPLSALTIRFFTNTLYFLLFQVAKLQHKNAICKIHRFILGRKCR